MIPRNLMASRRQFSMLLTAPVVMLGLSACGSLPSRPVRAAVYDFGPGALDAAVLKQPAGLPLLALADVQTSGGAIDKLAVLYRLGYADAQQLRPYAQAHWSMPAAGLVRQRLRQVLGQQHRVVSAGEGAALTRVQGKLPLVLQVELEEFSHFFESPTDSFALLRLQATLLENTPAGVKVLAQRQVVSRQPASTPDAPGGVRALATATDAAARELAVWLAQTEVAR
jgi:cholesterol transport system auxiliary component